MGDVGGQQQQQREREHIVMFPFMAQGHLIPFLSLAKLIQRRHPSRYTITLVNTPLNIRNLRRSHHHSSSNSNLLLQELPFSSADHGLPKDAENTDSLGYDDMVKLFTASQTLQPHFDRLLADITQRQGRPPLCVVADMVLGWTVLSAAKFHAFHATFSTCGAFGTAAYFAMWLHLPHLRTHDGYFPVPGFPDGFRLHRSQLARNIRDTDGRDAWATCLRQQLSHCLRSGGMLCNAVGQVETKGMELLRKVAVDLPVWAVGPILPKDGGSSDARTGKKAEVAPEACVEWLDRHPPASVLYASFGSQNTIGAAQMLQLAAGLEASGHPFIWVIRPPIGYDLAGGFRGAEWLPEGFEERMGESGRGLLVRNWAPQLEILSHGSTAAFLTHCGWNSVLEGLSSGVPLIGWPLAAEQFYNSKMLEEELGVLVELARGAVAEVSSPEVASVVRQVFAGERGEDMRRRAATCSDMIRAATWEGDQNPGASIKALDDFLEEAAAASARRATTATRPPLLQG